ncbi:MAG TPA: CDF family Co(II)/Ni(II) efflux transporter DmeF, partial [Steroidobacteraceae bacterium]
RQGDNMTDAQVPQDRHSHVFLGEGHEHAERRTWIVIALCGAMMVLEIGGGIAFGSLALTADGLHMSTHAGALLLAALAYTFARRRAGDARFTFGTGKFGDLAGFTSAIVLAMIAILIGYEAIVRFMSPVPIHFMEAIPIAVVGLVVNIVSAWLLSGGEHPGHSHSHGHGHGHGEHDHAEHEHATESRTIATAQGAVELSIFEQDVPPRFRLALGAAGSAAPLGLETLRPDGTRQSFSFVNRGDYWESTQEIPEPHAFEVSLQLADGRHEVTFEEHAHERPAHTDHSSRAHRDNNIRSAYIHVLADAAVSVLAITGLVLARAFGWMWMDPLAGVIGALVIANWSYGLMRDTGGILLDMNPDQSITAKVREAIESDGDRLLDLHLWRLGPGHLGAVVSVLTNKSRDCAFYRERLKNYKSLSHVTVEVTNAEA